MRKQAGFRVSGIGNSFMTHYVVHLDEFGHLGH